MSKPAYPTTEGNWSNGARTEESYTGVRLGVPYPDAVENFRKAMESRPDFDPATLFVWGTMQAKAVLGVLKAVEDAFGADGQEVVRKAINKAGYEAADGLLRSSVFPDDLTEIEFMSFFLTGINCVLYASLEKPWITSPERFEFEILWCPHQDVYTAFDCRVQRYFVEGMIEALEHHGKGRVLPVVHELIPRGAERCHFVVDRIGDDGARHPWHAYSDELGKRALEKLKESK
jgi:hypothetical protein